MIEYKVESQAPASAATSYLEIDKWKLLHLLATQFRGKIYPENYISYANTVIPEAKPIHFCTPSHPWKLPEKALTPRDNLQLLCVIILKLTFYVHPNNYSFAVTLTLWTRR